MPRFRRLTATEVREKSSPLDLVTEADEVAEAVMTAGLKAAFPDAIGARRWQTSRFVGDPTGAGVANGRGHRASFLPEALQTTVNGNLSRLAATTWF
jgi:hypothetical protein